WTNLVTACKKCNAKKGDFTPEDAHMTLRRKPYKPSYAIFLKDQLNGQADEWDAVLHGHQYCGAPCRSWRRFSIIHIRTLLSPAAEAASVKLWPCGLLNTVAMYSSSS